MERSTAILKGGAEQRPDGGFSERSHDERVFPREIMRSARVDRLFADEAILQRFVCLRRRGERVHVIPEIQIIAPCLPAGGNDVDKVRLLLARAVVKAAAREQELPFHAAGAVIKPGCAERFFLRRNRLKISRRDRDIHNGLRPDRFDSGAADVLNIGGRFAEDLLQQPDHAIRFRFPFRFMPAEPHRAPF